ncbi:MAG: DUF3850 domain-containing protein [Bacteroidales bacterium]|jgi:uncharacterized protein (TIGR02145 family)|nr:DUF3850 domain-containing protein [Bacteroidales bacterium]
MKKCKKDHTLKLDEKYYDLLVNGEKRFEVRYNDRDYAVGDFLFLECSNGRALCCVVRYILSDFVGLKPGYVVMDVDFLHEYIPGKKIQETVVINGVRWATRNVAEPGTFAANPEDSGMFYQWNRKKAYAATGDVTDWDSSFPTGTEWEKANDPSPAGYRLPTRQEQESLLDKSKVTNEWTTVNGVVGMKFTDKENENSIFLPAAGSRNYGNGKLCVAGEGSNYWSSTEYNSPNAYYLRLGRRIACMSDIYRVYGLSVRCVAE